MIELDGSVDSLEALGAAIAPGVVLGERPLDDLSAQLGEPGVIVWRDHERSAGALGRAATVAWLRGRLATQAVDRVVLEAMLDAVETAGEPTLFDYVIAMFESAGWRVELR